MSLDIGSRCVYCNRDTSPGSGLFVNRYPAEVDAYNCSWLSAEEQEIAETVEGYACPECGGYNCDACDKQIATDCDVHDADGGHFHEGCLPRELWRDCDGELIGDDNE